MNRNAVSLLLTMVTGFCASVALAQDNPANPPLHIDIPTALQKANVVIDYGHAVLNGDMPFALRDVNPLVTQFREKKTEGRIVVIFRGEAAISS